MALSKRKLPVCRRVRRYSHASSPGQCSVTAVCFGFVSYGELDAALVDRRDRSTKIRRIIRKLAAGNSVDDCWLHGQR